MLHPMLMKTELAPDDNLPNHWELLSKSDLDKYIKLRDHFYEDLRKSRKGERLETFVDKLREIQGYIENGDGDQWKRSVVCGIVFLSNSLAINIQQLRILLGKCKSSINGSLQQLGYTSLPQGAPLDKELTSKIPIFKSEKSEAKKWTIRENKLGKVSFSRIQRPMSPHQLLAHQTPPRHLVLPIIQTLLPPNDNFEKYTIKSATDVQNIMKRTFPCPVKFRAKFYDAIHHSVSIQTEA